MKFNWHDGGKAIQFLFHKDQRTIASGAKKKAKKNDNKHVKKMSQYKSVCLNQNGVHFREFSNVRTLHSLNGMSSIEQ